MLQLLNSQMVCLLVKKYRTENTVPIACSIVTDHRGGGLPIWMKESEPEGMTRALLLSNDTDFLEEKQEIENKHKNMTPTRHLCPVPQTSISG